MSSIKDNYTNNERTIKVIQDSLEYKLLSFQEIYREVMRRQKTLYYKYEPSSEKIKSFHESTEKIKILTGANRSGKTTAAIHEVIQLCLGEHPYINDIPEPSRWWVVVTKFSRLRETAGLLDKFKDNLPMNMVEKITESTKDNNYKILFKNGSEIYFKSQEERVNAFTAVSIHGALIDERITNDDIRNQLRMRLLDTDGRMYFTIDALEEDFWVSELVNKGLAFHEIMETQDNKFIPKPALERVEKELNKSERLKLLHGVYFDENRVEVFPQEIFNDKNYIPIEPISFDIDYKNNQLIQSEEGKLKLFVSKERNKKYIIGADVSEGIGRDESVATVISTDGEQIAVWHDNYTKTNEFAYILKFLSEYYNNALIVPENQGVAGGSLLNKLKEIVSHRIYFEYIRKYRNKHLSLELGVRTEANIKLEMINVLFTALQNIEFIIHYNELYKQLRNFIRYFPKGDRTKVRFGAKPNKKDDMVLSLFMALRPPTQAKWKKQFGNNLEKDEFKEKEVPKFWVAR